MENIEGPMMRTILGCMLVFLSLYFSFFIFHISNNLKLKFREIVYKRKSTEFLQCFFFAPELGLEPRTL